MSKKKAGGQRKEIDYRMFEELCKIQCTKQEICDVFQIDEKTLTARCKERYGMSFSDVQKEYKAHGMASLRRYQFSLAKKSAAMGIFLGKQYLGQKDQIHETSERKLTVINRIIEPED